MDKIRFYFFQLLSVFFPNYLVRKAYYALANPKVRRLRANEDGTLSKSVQTDYEFRGFNIKLYQWGSGSKSVLLIHGWEGQAGNFSDLIEQLLLEDVTIYAFDAPAHGYSSKGETSLFDFTDLVGILIKKFEVDRLISHSFGGVATTFALSRNPGLNIKKYCLITTPDRFSQRIDDISTQLGISDSVKQKLIKKIERDTQLKVGELNVSDFVQQIDVAEARIFHDLNDKVISIERSREVCSQWEACRLVEVENTGHFRILRTQSVIQEVAQFILAE